VLGEIDYREPFGAKRIGVLSLVFKPAFPQEL
jgi:hypothetical protein